MNTKYIIQFFICVSTTYSLYLMCFQWYFLLVVGTILAKQENRYNIAHICLTHRLTQSDCIFTQLH